MSVFATVSFNSFLSYVLYHLVLEYFLILLYKSENCAWFRTLQQDSSPNHIFLFLQSLHVRPVSQCRDFKILLLVYEALKSFVNKFLIFSLRRSGTGVLPVPRVGIEYGVAAFSFCAPNYRLKTHLFTAALSQNISTNYLNVCF